MKSPHPQLEADKLLEQAIKNFMGSGEQSLQVYLIDDEGSAPQQIPTEQFAKDLAKVLNLYIRGREREARKNEIMLADKGFQHSYGDGWTTYSDERLAQLQEEE